MKETRKYQPSNGSEGAWFTDEYCMRCVHCDPDPTGDKQCDILCATMVYNTKDEEYPKEWIYDEENRPTCTKWKYHNWFAHGKTPPTKEDFIDPSQMNIFGNE